MLVRVAVSLCLSALSLYLYTEAAGEALFGDADTATMYGQAALVCSVLGFIPGVPRVSD